MRGGATDAPVTPERPDKVIVAFGLKIRLPAEPTSSARTLAAIMGAGILATQIGEFLPHDRWVRREGRDLPLAPPAGDELWRVLNAGPQ